MTIEEFMDKVRKEFPTIQWVYKAVIGNYEPAHYAHSLAMDRSSIMSYTVKYSDVKKWTLSYIGVLRFTTVVENCSELSEARLQLRERLSDRVLLVKQNYDDIMARVGEDLKALEGVGNEK